MDAAENIVKSACAGCGEPFVCGASAGLPHCWCMDLPLVVLEADAASEAGCYCAPCLKKRISGESSPAA